MFRASPFIAFFIATFQSDGVAEFIGLWIIWSLVLFVVFGIIDSFMAKY